MASDKQPNESSREEDVDESIADTTGPSIGTSIDELESLIADSNIPTGPTPGLQPEIPVLNDIVDASEARSETETIAKTGSISSPTDNKDDLPIVRLSKLVDSVDKKLSNELDALVDILKDTIKDSIIDELKEQLKKEAAHPQSPHHATDDPDKPIE